MAFRPCVKVDCLICCDDLSMQLNGLFILLAELEGLRCTESEHLTPEKSCSFNRDGAGARESKGRKKASRMDLLDTTDSSLIQRKFTYPAG